MSNQIAESNTVKGFDARRALLNARIEELTKRRETERQNNRPTMLFDMDIAETLRELVQTNDGLITLLKRHMAIV